MATITAALPSGREFLVSLANGDFFLGRLEASTTASTPLFQSFDVSPSRRASARSSQSEVGSNPDFATRVARMRWSLAPERRRAAGLLSDPARRREGLLLLRGRARSVDDWMELAELAQFVYLPIAFEAYRQAYVGATNLDDRQEACVASGRLRRNDLSQAPIASCATGEGMLRIILERVFAGEDWVASFTDTISSTQIGQDFAADLEQGSRFDFVQNLIEGDEDFDRDLRRVIAALEPHRPGVEALYETFARHRAEWPPPAPLQLAWDPQAQPAEPVSPRQELATAQSQARALHELLSGLCRLLRAAPPPSECDGLITYVEAYQRYITPSSALAFADLAERDLNNADETSLSVIRDVAYVWSHDSTSNSLAPNDIARLEEIDERTNARLLALAQDSGNLDDVIYTLENLADEQEDAGLMTRSSPQFCASSARPPD